MVEVEGQETVARIASPRVAKLSVPGFQAEFQTAMAARRTYRQAFETKVLNMLWALQRPAAGRGQRGVTGGEATRPSLQWPPLPSQGILSSMQAMVGSARTCGPAAGGPGLIHGSFPATALAAQNVSALTGGGNFDAALDSLLGSGDGNSKVAGARGAAHQEHPPPKKQGGGKGEAPDGE